MPPYLYYQQQPEIRDPLSSSYTCSQYISIENIPTAANFTVTPVKVDIVSDKPAPKNRPQALDLLDVETETTETLTQSSITELLSSKFREVSNRIKEYSVPPNSPHYRKRIVSKWEALNYDAWENEISMAENEAKSKKEVRKTWLSRYFVMLMTGIATGLVALIIHLAVEYGAYYKFKLIKYCILS
ncbi:unnamed protein product [Acanthosepion pharaonis]|uniref:Uncharacterized protein n=1 Tax=Acanthosepion pharaonis TaxID=158019 RepID=A0A812CWV6_ACAPH|nr:unnamed protein product [Sepia pharaonis]